MSEELREEVLDAILEARPFHGLILEDAGQLLVIDTL